MFKRVSAFLCSIMLFVASVMTAVPIASAVGPNLVANPSAETGTATQPASFTSNKWGTNTTTFTYKNTGRTGTKSLGVKTTARTSGDAKWMFAPVNVTPNTSYTYSNWYQSNVQSEVIVAVTTTTGATQYVWQGSPAASAPWKQVTYTFTTPANASKVTVYQYLQRVGELTTDDYSLVNNSANPDPTAPTVSMSAPAAGATVSNTVSLAANASDAVAVSSVQFKVDGVNVGTADTTSPYGVSWDSKSVANGSHVLTAVATNSSGLSTTSTPVNVTVSNTVPPTAPTVSVTAPSNGSTLSNTVNLTANASDAQAVTSVQFKVDGANVGAADTTSPYSVGWDTKTVANGSRVITAVATNSAGLTTTSAPVTVTVSNTVTPPATNLIANPSVENGAATPTGWTGNSWGTNTSSLTYENTGRTGARSLKATTTSYTNGDAKWIHASVPATANGTYNYSNWYKSNVVTELDAMVTMSNGSVQYYWLASVPASADWKQVKAQFTAPAGATNLVIFQVMAKVGFVQTDDFVLEAHTPAKLNRALVSLTFDDSWRSIYDPGFGLLDKYSLKSTQYLNSQPTEGGYPDYMTYDMVKAFAAGGHELGWHTRTHADLTTLSVSAIGTELTIPTAFLSNINQTAANFKNFATPYGAYNATVVNEIKKKYRSHRSTDVGYNSKDSFDIYNIKVQNVTNTTTPAIVQAWVNHAIATNTWLVLVYHEVDAGAADPTYAVTPENLDAELNIIKQSGVAVVTVNQALDEILPQL